MGSLSGCSASGDSSVYSTGNGTWPSTLKDEKTLRAPMKSHHMKALRRPYDRWFGKVSERARFASTQVWP